MTHEVPQEGIPQSFGNIQKAHPGEWMLTRITKFDKRHTPVEGIVVAHSEFDGDITKEMKRAKEENPGAKFAFHFGPRASTRT